MITARMQAFDDEHRDSLRRIWFLGDVHGQFRHIIPALTAAPVMPNWLVFLGDLDLEVQPLREWAQPVCAAFPGLQLVFIHGNHDADSYEHWHRLHDSGPAIALHGQVLDMNGVRVAGMGGNFLGRVWMPPSEPTFANKTQAMNRGAFQWHGTQRPSPAYLAGIYPDEFKALAAQEADILVTHEAPSCHQLGFEALDELARSMRVVRTFHGHHHDDLSDQYALQRDRLQFDARALAFCAIKDGLGEIIVEGRPGW
jgi:calcineurin-like phosphoesterase family protein